MVKSHQYNTRSKNNELDLEENIYLITNATLTRNNKQNKQKKFINKKISKKKGISNDNSNSNSNSDRSDSDDDNEIASEMQDFIVPDDKSISCCSSERQDDSEFSDQDEDSSDNSGYYQEQVIDNKDDDKITMNKYQYAKFLNKIFPSNYTRDKINSIKRRRLLSPSSSSNNLNHIIYIDANILNNALSKRKHYQSEEHEYDDHDENDDDDKNDHDDDDENEDENDDDDDDKNEDENDDEEHSDIGEDDEVIQSLKSRYKEKGKTQDNPNPNLDSEARKQKAEIQRNFKDYKTLFNGETKNQESKYFRTVLTTDQQRDILQRLKTVKELTTVKKPYLIYLAELDIPDIYKACAINKFNQLSNMDESMASGEYYKLKTWIDGFVKIPFNKYAKIPVHVSDGLERSNQFITESKHILDSCVFGLNSAKMQILQLIGLWIVNPDSIGTSISLKGPMGVGKTTIIKEGISKILNRYFALIPLGGASDISHFEGHSYTYEGSTYGKIIDILIQSQQMNPIIYFDELDKVSDSPKGEEVIGLLTHLTDTTQNSCYHDKYFSELEFDLSKILYIFSYNDESKINPILRDRMYNIEIKGYTVEDKMSIARQHLLPKIRDNVNFTESDIVISDDIIKYIIQKYTEDEQGVRNLKRCFEILYTKLNLLKLLRNDNKEMYGLLNISSTIVLPVIMTNELLDKLLYKKELSSAPPFGMYN